MSAEHAIIVDPARRLLDVRMGGFYTPDDVRGYRQAIEAASVELGGDPGRQRMICDITEMQIQPQETVAAFAGFMADPRYATRKVAFIVSATLARMQIERAKGGRHAQTFLNRADALAWLLAEDRAAA
ncbi:hypothetical protein [Sphingomonas sp.]|uniref:hypothetical protein n=1 Tax=Sphingomonas sp. TaxID=28214 RepID=UPI002DD6726A|nr:hypothetical protein [Sphingomonas sp.]